MSGLLVLLGLAAWVVLALLGIAAYFIPAIIARIRHSENFPAVLAINSLFGWTFVGWVIAIALAVSGKPIGRQRLRLLAAECGHNDRFLRDDGSTVESRD